MKSYWLSILTLYTVVAGLMNKDGHGGHDHPFWVFVPYPVGGPPAAWTVADRLPAGAAAQDDVALEMGLGAARESEHFVNFRLADSGSRVVRELGNDVLPFRAPANVVSRIRLCIFFGTRPFRTNVTRKWSKKYVFLNFEVCQTQVLL